MQTSIQTTNKLLEDYKNKYAEKLQKITDDYKWRLQEKEIGYDTRLAEINDEYELRSREFSDTIKRYRRLAVFIFIEQDVARLEYELGQRTQQQVVNISTSKSSGIDQVISTESMEFKDAYIQCIDQELSIEHLGVWSKELVNLSSKYRRKEDFQVQVNTEHLDQPKTISKEEPSIFELANKNISDPNASFPFPPQLEQNKPEMISVDLQTDFEQYYEENVTIKDQTQLELVIPIDNEEGKEYVSPSHRATQITPRELKIVDLESFSVQTSKLIGCEFGTDPISELISDENIEELQSELTRIKEEYQLEINMSQELKTKHKLLEIEHKDVVTRLSEVEEFVQDMKKDIKIGKIFTNIILAESETQKYQQKYADGLHKIDQLQNEIKLKEDRIKDLNRKFLLNEGKVEQLATEKDILVEEADKQSANLRRQYSMIINGNEFENKELIEKIAKLEADNLELVKHIQVRMI